MGGERGGESSPGRRQDRRLLPTGGRWRGQRVPGTLDELPLLLPGDAPKSGFIQALTPGPSPSGRGETEAAQEFPTGKVLQEQLVVETHDVDLQPLPALQQTGRFGQPQNRPRIGVHRLPVHVHPFRQVRERPGTRLGSVLAGP